MKLVLLALALSSTLAFAAEKPFASCAGDHHGTYLDISADAAGKISIETSDDSAEASEVWRVVSVKKDFTKIPVAGQSWAIRQAIKSAKAQDGLYGMVMIEAKLGASTMYVQLNKTNSSQSFMSVMGYVEQLECSVL